jgi:hypothetical protein
MCKKMDGFGNSKLPTGYGVVSCKATLNGYELGVCWSKKTTYSEGTEHAEDAVCDHMQSLLFALGGFQMPEGIVADLHYVIPNGKNLLEITDLTASPCSSSTTPKTCNKPDTAGCTERLIELIDEWRQDGYKLQISIQADHYYQPKISGAKRASAQAVEALEDAGIAVSIG